MVTRQATAESAPMASCCKDRQPTKSDEADLGEESEGVLVEGWDVEGCSLGWVVVVGGWVVVVGWVAVEGGICEEGILEGGLPGVPGKVGRVREAVSPVPGLLPIADEEFLPETVVPLMRVAFLVALRMSELSDVSFKSPSAGPWEPVTLVSLVLGVKGVELTFLDVLLAVVVVLVAVMLAVVLPLVVLLAELLKPVALVPLTAGRALVVFAVMFAVVFPDIMAMRHWGRLFSVGRRGTDENLVFHEKHVYMVRAVRGELPLALDLQATVRRWMDPSRVYTCL